MTPIPSIHIHPATHIHHTSATDSSTVTFNLPVGAAVPAGGVNFNLPGSEEQKPLGSKTLSSVLRSGGGGSDVRHETKSLPADTQSLSAAVLMGETHKVRLHIWLIFCRT